MTESRTDFVLEERLFGLGKFVDRLATFLPFEADGLLEDGIGLVGYAHLKHEVFVETVDFGSVVVTDRAESEEVLGGVSCSSVIIGTHQSQLKDTMAVGALRSFEAHGKTNRCSLWDRFAEDLYFDIPQGGF